MSERTDGLASYPRVNPVFTPVVVDENEVHFTAGPWSGPVFEIVDDDRDGTLADLVSRLDGRTHVDELLDAFAPEDRSDVAAVLRSLQEKSIVRDPGERVDERRAKLGGYLSVSDAESDAVDRITRSIVTVVGAGEVGRRVAEDLLAADVGAVRYVALSSPPEEWDGSLDRDRLQSIEPRALRDALAASDFGVVAVDRPYPWITATMNDVAHETGTPWTLGVVDGVDGQVGPTVYPGETACYECFRDRADAATRSRLGNRRVERSGGVAAALLPSFAGVVAGMVATDVLRQLAGAAGVTTGRVVTYDFHDFAVQADDVLRVPRCGTCGKSPERLDSPRHRTLDSLVETVGEGE
ncbi:TOMM precursor leader peptide-binding protein [Halomicrobium salinisoli]|uniref:TOMM precursor leader peptide-binding protein n=1 Tax=Halomicrobium salinisoli TaxID=2878391 RepID=UPI001CF01C75|nr:TOMM precursor leader peptide-binding protein [Halomicrobium salinisoli]